MDEQELIEFRTGESGSQALEHGGGVRAAQIARCEALGDDVAQAPGGDERKAAGGERTLGQRRDAQPGLVEFQQLPGFGDQPQPGLELGGVEAPLRHYASRR